MCAKILESAGKLNMDEYDFFLRGGIVSAFTIVTHVECKRSSHFIFPNQVIDRENQMDNPLPWLPETAWDNITELDKQANFHGLITSFEQYPRDWNLWYTAPDPETAGLPGLEYSGVQKLAACRFA